MDRWQTIRHKNISGYSDGGRSHDPIRPYLVSLAAPPRFSTRREGGEEEERREVEGGAGK